MKMEYSVYSCRSGGHRALFFSFWNNLSPPLRVGVLGEGGGLEMMRGPRLNLEDVKEERSGPGALGLMPLNRRKHLYRCIIGIPLYSSQNT